MRHQNHTDDELRHAAAWLQKNDVNDAEGKACQHCAKTFLDIIAQRDLRKRMAAQNSAVITGAETALKMLERDQRCAGDEVTGD